MYSVEAPVLPKRRVKKSRPWKVILISYPGKTKTNTLRLFIKKYPKRKELALIKVFTKQSFGIRSFRGFNKGWVTVFIPSQINDSITEKIIDILPVLRLQKRWNEISKITYTL